jgi:hypothetical protein
MGSVLRIFRDHAVGADAVHVHATWLPCSHWRSLRHSARAARRIRRLTGDVVIHVHLSERGSFLREGALLTYGRRRGLHVAASLHGAEFVPFARRHPRLVSTVLRNAAVIAALDDESLRTYVRWHLAR